jgi:hypothetical protein
METITAVLSSGDYIILLYVYSKKNVGNEKQKGAEVTKFCPYRKEN